MNKLIEIQRELIVTKNQFNQFGNYNFRSSEDILLALKPLLVRLSGVLVVTDKIHHLGDNIIYIESIATLTIDDNSFTASSFARDALQQKGMSASQCTNSASSFAKKQALCNLFLIDDSADIAPSQEEQVETEKLFKEEKVKAEEEAKLKTDDFLNNVAKTIGNSQSMEELKGVFGAFYRESSKMDKKVMDAVTEYYTIKKGELNASL